MVNTIYNVCTKKQERAIEDHETLIFQIKLIGI